jgi:hypothetical protein
MDDEILITIKPSKDGKTVTVELKSSQKISTGQVIVELEYLINQLSRAEEDLKRPGVAQH